MPATLSIEGKTFDLLGTQRSGAAVYRGQSEFLRIGEKSNITRDLALHHEMEKAHYPVAEIRAEGEHEGKGYFIEASLGRASFRALFADDYATGSITDTNFARFVAVAKKLFVAEVRAAQPKWNIQEFAAGINLMHLSREIGGYGKAIEERFVEVAARLQKMPGTLLHGDCNAANMYEGGVIDLEDSFYGPVGYDIVSALMTADWSPLTREHEFHAHYRFTDDQKNEYVQALLPIAKKAQIHISQKDINDLAFCRAIWLCSGMNAWPRLQQWRFDKLIREYLS